MDINRILRISTIVLGAILLAFLSASAFAQLPTSPPSFGGGAASKDIWEYTTTAGGALLTAAAIILAAVALVSVGGGMVKALQEGRDKGEWGRFLWSLLASIAVLVFIIWAVLSAIEYLKDL